MRNSGRFNLVAPSSSSVCHSFLHITTSLLSAYSKRREKAGIERDGLGQGLYSPMLAFLILRELPTNETHEFHV